MSYDHVFIWLEAINPYFLVLLGVTGFFIHFLPTFIAIHYKRKDQVNIFILNVLFGWTGVVWIVLLVWSMSNPPRNKEKQNG